jgi:hypothetical protein
MRRKFILLLLLVTVLAPLSARGRAESGGPVGGRPVYLVFGAGEEPDPLFLERWHLPLGAAAYAWTAFSAGNGEVSLQEAGGQRILAKELILKEPVDGLLVYGFALKASGYDALPGPAREILTVRYGYARQPGQGLIVQPARRFVRLQELVYLGAGRFRARVALR